MRTKIAYDFAPVPKKRDPRWKNLRNIIGRHLYAELFMLTEGKPFAIAGEWDVFICRELCIPGPQRTNFCRALREMESVGLITASATHVDIVFMEPAQGAAREQAQSSPRAGAEQLESRSRAAAVQVVSSLDSSPRNDSTPIRQTEETDRREETDENAGAGAGTREDLIGFNFVASLLGRNTFSIPPLGAALRQYTWIGGRPETERAAVKLAVEADPWCQANKHLVDGKHLELRWQRYLGGAPKPVVRAEPEVRKPVLEMHQEWKPMEYFYPKLNQAAAK